MSRAKSLLFVTVLALVVAACGGGGGSGTNSANTPRAHDTIAPPTPPRPPASAARASTINLTWSAATHQVGGTGCIVKRHSTPAATPTSTSFADTSLLPGFTYSYTVAAGDAAGNVSPESASASATTIDTIAPSTPTGLVATAAGGSVVNLTWSASTDNVGVTGYIVKRNGAQVATPITTSYSDTGLSDATTYSYTVAARDAAGNFSAISAIVSATTPDATPPSPPAG